MRSSADETLAVWGSASRWLAVSAILVWNPVYLLRTGACRARADPDDQQKFGARVCRKYFRLLGIVAGFAIAVSLNVSGG